MKKENRILDPSFVSFRAIEEDGKKFLIGYASVFNQRSKLIYENGKFFYEVIAPNAFDEVLRENPDVILNFNHQRDKVIARTKSGTLQLSTDDKGLLFRAELPNVSYALDVYELVSRGDLFENSFAFVIRKGDDEWSKDADGNLIRLVKKVSRLLDVSVVTDGAYANTEVSARFSKEDLNQLLDRSKKITIIIEEGEEEEPEMEPEMEQKVEEVIEKVEEVVEEEKVEEDGCKKKREEQEKLQMLTRILKLKQ